LQKELAHFGPGLGPGGFAFHEPFADLSRISRLKNEISETNVYARVAFIIYANQCARVQIVQGKMPNMNTITYIYVFKNSGIQTFRTPRFRGLSPLQQNTHTHPYLQLLRKTCQMDGKA